jgi:plasmid replication initiation protein
LPDSGNSEDTEEVMSSRNSSGHQPDFFVPMLSDLQLRDQRETMERPFFSLSKRKRMTPINYTSPDGSITVVVKPHQDYGMPTIWDADLLIWAASTLNGMKKRGANDIPRKLPARPYELLKSIGRGTGGENARQLHEAALRLRNASITTNLRVRAGEKPENFSWLDKVTVVKRRIDKDEPDDNQYASFIITVSDWFYDAVLQDGSLLSIDPAYFAITGGRERWLYRIVRKHAGGAGEAGFSLSFPTLFEKSGAEGTYRRFKFELLKIIGKNPLPGFDIQLEARSGSSEPWMHMVRKGPWPDTQQVDAVRKAAASDGATAGPALSDKTVMLVRRHCPGLDLHALKADFDVWLVGVEPPGDYQKAFYGFCRQAHKRLNA